MSEKQKGHGNIEPVYGFEKPWNARRMERNPPYDKGIGWFPILTQTHVENLRRQRGLLPSAPAKETKENA